MIHNLGPGKLIVLEGLDGAGTTTQTRELAEYLRIFHTVKAWPTREPSDGPAGAQIRAALTRRLSVDKRVLAGLFAVDRLDHLYSKGGVKERLENGQWVIMDRYYLSSFAYQAMDMDHEELDWLMSLHQPCIQPDITLFVDVPVRTSLERIAINRGFHFELFETEDALLRVRNQYLSAIRMLRERGETIHVIPGTETKIQVERNIRLRIKSKFLDKDYLPQQAEKSVWDWEILKKARQRVEEDLGLTFLAIKELPPSMDPEKPSMETFGGYQIDFLSENRKQYHILTFFKKGKKAIGALKALGPTGEILNDMQKICQNIYSQTITYPLFPEQQ